MIIHILTDGHEIVGEYGGWAAFPVKDLVKYDMSINDTMCCKGWIYLTKANMKGQHFVYKVFVNIEKISAVWDDSDIEVK